LSSDWYTKLILTVIAACLGLLVAQSYREGASGAEGGRYSLTFVPMARMMFRIDSETGETWKGLFPDVKIWTPVADSPSELLDEVSAEVSAEALAHPEPPAPAAAPPEAPAAAAPAAKPPGDTVTP